MSDLAIGAIKVIDRHRSDLGDLSTLVESIRENGLLHPIVITAENRLVAGQRRLEACRQLGFEEVPVRVVTNLTSAVSLLRAERDENTCRKEMTPLERKSLTDALLELERPAARERQAHGETAPGRNASIQANISVGPASKIAAEAAGWSQTSYWRTTQVLDAATDPDEDEEVRAEAIEVLGDMEAGTTSVNTGHERVKAKRQCTEARKAPGPKKQSAATRVEQISALTAKGYAPRQIAEKLDLSESRVRIIAKANGVALLTVLDRTYRIDSNRIVNEAVNTLEALVTSLGLVEVGQLDLSKVDYWATSLRSSLPALNRLAKQLKEIAQ